MQLSEFKNLFSVKMKSLNDALQKTIKKKSAGFYVSLSAAVLSLVSAITYTAGYYSSEFFTWWIFVSALIAPFAFIGLSWHKYTVPFAPVVLGVSDLAAFLLFIRHTYIYLSEVFYGGINMESIKTIKPIFIVCLVFLLVCVILSIVGICLSQEKKTNEGGENE